MAVAGLAPVNVFSPQERLVVLVSLSDPRSRTENMPTLHSNRRSKPRFIRHIQHCIGVLQQRGDVREQHDRLIGGSRLTLSGVCVQFLSLAKQF